MKHLSIQDSQLDPNGALYLSLEVPLYGLLDQVTVDFIMFVQMARIIVIANGT